MDEKNEILENVADSNTVKENPIAIEETKTEEKPNNSYGVASMVFGILSLASFVVTLPLGSVFPLIGIIFAVMDRAKYGKMTKEAKTGFICSIIAYSLTVLMIFALIILIVIIFTFLPELMLELEASITNSVS